MNILPYDGRRRSGFVLLLVLVLLGISLLILAGDMRRTNAVANLNQRNGEYQVCCRAAEAAVEKVYARMAYDFQSQAIGGVKNSLPQYPTNIPTAAENPFWANFVFSDPSTGTAGYTYVRQVTNYSGVLPTAYVSQATTNAPVYRIISNVQMANSGSGVVGTAQEDVLLALVPLSNKAIFYNGFLDFTNCAPMVVNGPVHANGPIQVGSANSSSSTLTFNGAVTTTSTLTDPFNNFSGVTFKASPGYVTNVPSVTCALNMTNSHFIIDVPPAGEDSMSSTGQQRLYNQANMVLLITNPVVGSTNPTVQLVMQISSDGGITVPGADLYKNTNTFYFTNASPSLLSSNLPFLSLTNSFYDQRDTDTNIVTQIDVGAYATWAANNPTVQGKFQSISGIYPTSLYVADRRTYKTNQQLTVVRLSNAAQLPSNNGMGFSVVTPNPLYTWGNYNTMTGGVASTGTNNTHEVPSALMSDALTVLSGNWTDPNSFTYLTGYTSRNPSDTTINAAIVTGNVTNISNSAGDGGVENLPRLLEDWAAGVSGSQQNIYLNTSIICLWQSKMATNVFQNPGIYYTAPKRFIFFDQHFLDPANVPPCIPVAYVPLRFAYAVPPPGVTNYSVPYN
jgi:hypothetical protein